MIKKRFLSMLVLLCLATSGAWAAYYAWSGGGSSPFYFDDTANWGFKTSGSGTWIAVPAIGSRSDNINIDPTLLVDDEVVGVAYDVGWKRSFPASWNKTITFRNTTSLIAPIYLNYSGETVSFVATDASYGLTSSNQLWVRSGSTLQIESGTYTFASDVVVQGSLTVTNAMLKNTARYLRIGDGGNGTVTIGPGGVYENFGDLGSLTVAHASGNSGTLNVAGGTVSISGVLNMCYNESSVSAAVNVTDGGVLTVKRLVLRYAGTSGGVVTLDGGTLRAYADESSFVGAHESLRVYAGANGATFDSNGKTITIAESIEDKSGEAGVVRFTGGGTITLSGTPSYTGGTTNVAGTVLSLTTEAKAAIVAHPIAVEIPPAGVADGTTVLEINDGNGTFSQAEVDAIAVTGPDASRYALVLADGGTKVVISATPALALSETTDNSAALTEWDGYKADVTLTRTLQAGGWNTLALPFSMDIPSGWTVKELSTTTLENGTLTLNFADAESIVAGTPYLVKVTDAVANPTFDDVIISKTAQPTVTDYANFVPVFSPTNLEGGNTNILFVTGGNTLTYPTADGNINGFRAYFLLHDVPAAGVRAFAMSFDDDATSIETIDHSPLNIDHSVYDLQGRRMANGQSSTVDGQSLKKGVYIVNGKKTVIK